MISSAAQTGSTMARAAAAAASRKAKKEESEEGRDAESANAAPNCAALRFISAAASSSVSCATRLPRSRTSPMDAPSRSFTFMAQARYHR